MRAHGADFIVNADIAQLLRHQTYRDLDEHANPLGFYKKPYGDTIYLQVRRPNEPPNLTWFGGCAQSERLWGTRDAQLDSELIERLRAYAPIAKRLLAAPAGVRATETTGPGARLRAAPMLPAWIDESIRYGMGGWTFDKPCGDRATYVQVRAASPCVVERFRPLSRRPKSSWRDVLMSWYIPSFFNFENSKRCILVLNPIGTSGNGTAPELITVSSSNSKDHKWWFKLGLS